VQTGGMTNYQIGPHQIQISVTVLPVHKVSIILLVMSRTQFSN